MNILIIDDNNNYLRIIKTKVLIKHWINSIIYRIL